MSHLNNLSIMENYKPTIIDCKVSVVNLLGLQKKFIFVYPLNCLIHVPQQKLTGQYLKILLMVKNPL